MGKSTLAAITLVLLVGCGDMASEPALPTADFDATAAALPLPKSTTAQALEAPLVRIALSHTALLVSDDPHPLLQFTDSDAKALAQTGLPARAKRSGANDLSVSALQPLLMHRRDAAPPPPAASAPDAEAPAHQLLILADKATPYRVLVEVVYTAAQASLESHIAVAPDGKHAIPVSTQRAWGGVPRSRIRSKRLNLTALITADGIAMTTSAGNIAPGCRHVGRGIALPKSDGEYDYAGLAACTNRLMVERPNPADTEQATLIAAAATDLQTVVLAIDALRGGEGNTMRDVSLGLAR